MLPRETIATAEIASEDTTTANHPEADVANGLRKVVFNWAFTRI
jgi:hypothetical protein